MLTNIKRKIGLYTIYLYTHAIPSDVEYNVCRVGVLLLNPVCYTYRIDILPDVQKLNEGLYNLFMATFFNL